MLTKLIATALISLAALQAHAAVITLQPGSATGKDAGIANGTQAAVNFGASAALTSNAAGASDRFALIEFDLSPYIGQNVGEAYLGFFALPGTRAAGQVYSLSMNLAPWSEASVTYNNAPASGPVIATMVSSANQIRYEFEVSSALYAWMYGIAPNYGFRLTETNGVAVLASSDAAMELQRPFLEFDVPEPGSLALLGMALLGFAAARRRAGR